MAPALTQDRNTPELEEGGKRLAHPLAAATTVYAGGLVCLNAAGDAVPGSTALNLTPVGVAEKRVENPGAAGVESVLCRRGTFRFANDAGDAIDRTHIGGTAYIVDDQTVAATNGGGTRSAAGKIVQVDADGVWVEIE